MRPSGDNLMGWWIVPMQGVVRLATKHYMVSSMWVAGLIVLAFFQVTWAEGICIL
jgi:hypothetical protein